MARILNIAGDKCTLRLVCKTFKSVVDSEITSLSLTSPDADDDDDDDDDNCHWEDRPFFVLDPLSARHGDAVMPNIIRTTPLPKLRILYIGNTRLDSSTARHIAGHLASNLESLKLIGCEIDEDAARVLSTGHWGKLQELRVSCYDLKNCKPEHFAKFLSHCPVLKTLHASEGAFQVAQFEAIVKVDMPCLEILLMRHSDVPGYLFGEAAQHWAGLKHLNLFYCNLEDDDVEALCKAHFVNLEELYIGRTYDQGDFDDDTIPFLRGAMENTWKRLKCLEVRNFSENMLSILLDTDVPFAHLEKIRELDVSTPYDDETLAALAKAAREGRLPAYKNLIFHLEEYERRKSALI